MGRVIRKLKNMTLEGLPGIYPGFVNTDFYLHGYAPYFSLETCMRIKEDFLDVQKKRGFHVKIEYLSGNDCFVYKDFDVPEDSNVWKAQDVLTECGMRHLYQFGENWMWDINTTH